jgi:hypothetical protein
MASVSAHPPEGQPDGWLPSYFCPHCEVSIPLDWNAIFENKIIVTCPHYATCQGCGVGECIGLPAMPKLPSQTHLCLPRNVAGARPSPPLFSETASPRPCGPHHSHRYHINLYPLITSQTTSLIKFWTRVPAKSTRC